MRTLHTRCLLAAPPQRHCRPLGFDLLLKLPLRIPPNVDCVVQYRVLEIEPEDTVVGLGVDAVLSDLII